jgi:hypothetical protein
VNKLVRDLRHVASHRASSCPIEHYQVPTNPLLSICLALIWPAEIVHRRAMNEDLTKKLTIKIIHLLSGQSANASHAALMSALTDVEIQFCEREGLVFKNKREEMTTAARRLAKHFEAAARGEMEFEVVSTDWGYGRKH